MQIEHRRDEAAACSERIRVRGFLSFCAGPRALRVSNQRTASSKSVNRRVDIGGVVSSVKKLPMIWLVAEPMSKVSAVVWTFASADAWYSRTPGPVAKLARMSTSRRRQTPRQLLERRNVRLRVGGLLLAGRAHELHDDAVPPLEVFGRVRARGAPRQRILPQRIDWFGGGRGHRWEPSVRLL